MFVFELEECLSHLRCQGDSLVSFIFELHLLRWFAWAVSIWMDEGRLLVRRFALLLWWRIVTSARVIVVRIDIVTHILIVSLGWELVVYFDGFKFDIRRLVQVIVEVTVVVVQLVSIFHVGWMLDSLLCNVTISIFLNVIITKIRYFTDVTTSTDWSDLLPYSERPLRIGRLPLFDHLSLVFLKICDGIKIMVDTLELLVFCVALNYYKTLPTIVLAKIWI